MRKCLSCIPQLESYTTGDRLNRVVIAQKAPGQNVADVETTQLLQHQTGIPFAQVLALCERDAGPCTRGFLDQSLLLVLSGANPMMLSG